MSDILTDPRLAKPLAQLTALLVECEDWNHPLRAGERVGGSGKPSGRSPGAQDCEWYVKRMSEIVAEAAEKAGKARQRVDPKPVRSEEVRSIGGVPVKEPESQKVLREVVVTQRRGRVVIIARTKIAERLASPDSVK